jgi:N-acetyl-1-D-myo-inositol-2-amino-2-deoxy-alpha-D-glucopyranoside deacetylase
LLLVHAHPDDESIGTGATMAKYAAEGAQVTLVTCTLGELGEIIPPSLAQLAAEREDRLGAYRIGELAAACAALGVTDHRFLGGPGRWRDSGMMGTPGNEDSRCFWQADVDEAAQALLDVIREVRPQVLVTYDANGFYGHPDHIQAHRITVAALTMIDYEPTLYFNAIPASVMVTWRARWEQEDRERAEADAAKGIVREPEVPDPDEEEFEMGTPDDDIGATIDVSEVSGAKFDALEAHASQIAESFWMKMGRERFMETMRTEWFVRVTNPKNLEGNVKDIFAGYR